MIERNNKKVTSEIIRLYNDVLARFEGHNEVSKTIVLFCHHAIFAEVLSEDIEERLDYIIDRKPEDEWVTRLKWIQPYIPDKRMEALDNEFALISVEYADIVKAWKDFEAEGLHLSHPLQIKSFSEKFGKCNMRCYDVVRRWTDIYIPIFMIEHPKCPWNGRTLFPQYRYDSWGNRIR